MGILSLEFPIQFKPLQHQPKKHKKKECEKNSRSTKSNEENIPSNDIDLWLEDVSNQPVAKDTIDDVENVYICLLRLE